MDRRQSSVGHAWQVSSVTVYRPPNPDIKRLSSARASDRRAMLGSTVRVGSEVDETLNQNMSPNQTTTEPKQRKRQATEPIHLSQDDTDESFLRFLVVEATRGSPISYSILQFKSFRVGRGQY